MAELHVQRKRGTSIWLWVFFIILLMAGGIYYYMHSHHPETYPLQTNAPAN